jgi:hypothetical protein
MPKARKAGHRPPGTAQVPDRHARVVQPAKKGERGLK